MVTLFVAATYKQPQNVLLQMTLKVSACIWGFQKNTIFHKYKQTK